MSKNANLSAAKRNKNDEFYTLITDVERELMHYREHFKGKSVFCNCDDPEYSNFWQYFKLNFDFLGLKSLTSTHYSEDESTYRLDMFRDNNGEIQSTKTLLEQNGDFRSPEAIEILKESDIVVTNPPFSLFREYLEQLMEYEKDFLIIGSYNAITYKEIFPLLKHRKMWLGNGNGMMTFEVPNTPEYANKSGFFVKDGKAYSKLGNICWYTNLDIAKRHEELILWKKYTKEEYPHYDNYDAINVNRVKDIPVDYNGVMGVPVTFLDSHNPEQFEIVGITSGRDEFEARPTKRYINAKQHNTNGTIVSGSKANTRATILLDEPPNSIYYTADNAERPMKIVYARILIQAKRSELE